MKTITIPANVMNPYVVDINGVKYSYAAGSTVSVPDEVAEAITNALRLSPREDPPVKGSVLTFGENAGKWEMPKGVDAVPTKGSESTVSSGGVWQAIEDAKVTPEQLETATAEVLAQHPEWTTTIQDGAVTRAKLAAAVQADIDAKATSASVTAMDTRLTAAVEAAADSAGDANDAVAALIARLKSGDEADAELHLGFYLDENGDLCQVEETEGE